MAKIITGEKTMENSKDLVKLEKCCKCPKMFQIKLSRMSKI